MAISIQTLEQVKVCRKLTKDELCFFDSVLLLAVAGERSIRDAARTIFRIDEIL